MIDTPPYYAEPLPCNSAHGCLVWGLRRERHFAPYRFILRHGKPYGPALMPDEVPAGKPMCCFANAFQLASECRELLYVEGYGTQPEAPTCPLRHAWCIDTADRVVDPTWGTPPLPLALRGVVLPLGLVQPYATDYSCGTLDGAMADRIDGLATILGVDPV